MSRLWRSTIMLRSLICARILSNSRFITGLEVCFTRGRKCTHLLLPILSCLFAFFSKPDHLEPDPKIVSLGRYGKPVFRPGMVLKLLGGFWAIPNCNFSYKIGPVLNARKVCYYDPKQQVFGWKTGQTGPCRHNGQIVLSVGWPESVRLISLIKSFRSKYPKARYLAQQ